VESLVHAAPEPTGISGMGLCVKHLWHQIFTRAKISACTTNMANLLPFTLSQCRSSSERAVTTPHHKYFTQSHSSPSSKAETYSQFKYVTD